jgi:LPXTG-motif cell wall-anchored protein
MKSTCSIFAVFILAVVAMFGLVAGTAAAQEPETKVDPDKELADGDEVDVSITGFAAGAEVTVAQCGVWPVTGPDDCDISTSGDYVITADDSGAGTTKFPVFSGTRDEVTCDADNACYIVASAGDGADAIAAGAEITFVGGETPTEEPTEEPTEAPTEEPTETPTATETATPTPTATIPETGAESTTMAIVGVGIVLAGLLLVGVSRRLGRI